MRETLCRPEENSRQTDLITALQLALSQVLIVGNLLQLHLLALRIPNIERDGSAHHLRCVQAQSSRNQRTPIPWRRPSGIGVALFETQYNLEMADRIACSCVTCPKCGSWVVLTQPSRVRTGEEKWRANCPVSECGNEFVFDLGETRVFELPLLLFERRHFYRSELS